MYNHTKGLKKNGDDMWDEVAKEIANMINDDYAIVYMDFNVMWSVWSKYLSVIV